MNLAHRYAALLASPSTPKVDAVLAYMKSRGHSSLIGAVLRRLEAQASTSDKARVLVANADDAQMLATPIAQSLKELGASEYAIAVDPRAVGGYAVRAGGRVIDQTYRRALVDLYKKITA